MNPHKLLLLLWIGLLVAGILAFAYEEISLSRIEVDHLGPIEIRRPARTEIEIPRPMAVGAIAAGAGLTLYTIFFRLR
jgi:hypothetical protein